MNITQQIKEKKDEKNKKLKAALRLALFLSTLMVKPFKKWETVKDFLDQKELEFEEDEPNVNEMEGDQFEEQEADDQIWLESTEVNDIYNMIERGSFVAIRAEPNPHEMFHVMMVQDKHIAKEDIEDASEEHCILKGEPYLVGKWFSFQKETSKFVCFKESKNTELALIHIQEVFSTNLEINDHHQMDILTCSV